MPTQCQLTEYSRAPVVNGVIKNVKIIGTRSRQGKVYPQAMLARAINLYENAPVYIMHPTAREDRLKQRKHSSHFGHLADVHEGVDGLFGDLHVKQSHGLAGTICKSDGRDFGLSHHAFCLVADDKTEVLDILRVDSVDLVDDPGTTINLFESMEDEEMDLAEMEAAQKAQADQITELKEGQGKMLTLLEGLQPAEPADKPKPKGRISVLSQADDPDGEALPTFGHSHEAFGNGLRGITGGIRV